MCTSISLSSKDNTHLLARTMDFSLQLDPEMMVFPRHFPLEFHSGTLNEHYAFMGLSKNIGGYFIADGVNEHGLSAAALYFEGYASYKDIADATQTQVLPHELIMWILAKCQSVSETVEMLNNIDVVAKVLDFIGSTPPLHFIFLDRNGESIIVEFMSDGIHIHENKLGVLTNSPDYTWHLTNVRSYIGLDPKQVESRTLYGETFNPFGQGSGTFGLPGDFTPPSRFIKTLYNKLSSQKAQDRDALVLQAMHILNGVDIPLGSVITQRSTIDYTQYTSYILCDDPIYYYRMANSLQVQSVRLKDHDLDRTEIIVL